MDRPWIICTALEFERKALARRLKGLLPDGWRLEVIGLRGSRLNRVLPDQAIGGILLVGLAGALDPALRAGQVIVDENCALDRARFGYHFGRIYMSDRVLVTPEEKAELLRSSGAVAVEMEAGNVRRAAESMGVPFIHIRAISDTADQKLDPAILQLTDHEGRTRPGAVVALLLRRPAMLAQLLRLRSNSRAALDNLAAAIKVATALLVSGF